MAVLSVLVLLVLNVIVAQTAIAPRAPWDEVAPLEMARRLAGRGPVTPMDSPGYNPGWGILLTPIWWFTQDPQTVYRAAIGVVIALAMLTVWPLSLLAKKMGLSTPQAVTAAALALSLPARTVNADYALAENLLALLIVCTALAAFSLWSRPGLLRVLLFSAAATGCYLAHVRGLAVMLAAAIWLVFFLLRDWKVALAGLAFLAAGYVLVQFLVRVVALPIMLGGFLQSERLFSKMSNLDPSLVARVAFEQTWAQLAGSYGVIAVGFVGLAVLSWREVRGKRVGPHGFVLGLFLIAFAVSVLGWAVPGPQGRFDAQVYTRYIDPYALLLVVVALVMAFRVTKRSLLWVALALSALDVLVVYFRVAPWANTWGTMDGPANSAAVLAFTRWKTDSPFAHPLIPSPTNANAFWFWGSLAVAVGFLTLLVLRKHPGVLSVVLLLGFATLSLGANPSQAREYPASIATSVEKIEAASGTPDNTLPVNFDLSCRGAGATFDKALNWTGYWLSPRRVDAVESEKHGFDSPVVVSCRTWPRAKELGAYWVPGSDFETYRVWVLPGELQRSLQKDGLLRPAE